MTPRKRLPAPRMYEMSTKGIPIRSQVSPAKRVPSVNSVRPAEFATGKTAKPSRFQTPKPLVTLARDQPRGDQSASCAHPHHISSNQTSGQSSGASFRCGDAVNTADESHSETACADNCRLRKAAAWRSSNEIHHGHINDGARETDVGCLSTASIIMAPIRAGQLKR